MANDVYPTTVQGTTATVRVVFEDGLGQEELAEWKNVPPMVRSATKRVYEANAHAPYKESLVRFLQHGGAVPSVVQASRLLRCQVCEANARHAPRPAVATPRYQHFSDATTMDCMIIPDVNKSHHCVLVIVDVASDFTVAKYVCEGSRPRTEAAREVLEEAWLSWAEPPLFGIQLGQDSAFLCVVQRHGRLHWNPASFRCSRSTLADGKRRTKSRLPQGDVAFSVL